MKRIQDEKEIKGMKRVFFIVAVVLLTFAAACFSLAAYLILK